MDRPNWNLISPRAPTLSKLRRAHSTWWLLTTVYKIFYLCGESRRKKKKKEALALALALELISSTMCVQPESISTLSPSDWLTEKSFQQSKHLSVMQCYSCLFVDQVIVLFFCFFLTYSVFFFVLFFIASLSMKILPGSKLCFMGFLLRWGFA